MYCLCVVCAIQVHRAAHVIAIQTRYTTHNWRAPERLAQHKTCKSSSTKTSGNSGSVSGKQGNQTGSGEWMAELRTHSPAESKTPPRAHTFMHARSTTKHDDNAHKHAPFFTWSLCQHSPRQQAPALLDRCQAAYRCTARHARPAGTAGRCAQQLAGSSSRLAQLLLHERVLLPNGLCGGSVIVVVFFWEWFVRSWLGVCHGVARDDGTSLQTHSEEESYYFMLVPPLLTPLSLFYHTPPLTPSHSLGWHTSQLALQWPMCLLSPTMYLGLAVHCPCCAQ